MKKNIKAAIYKICTLCIAFAGLFYYRGPCLLFFGEPEFKED